MSPTVSGHTARAQHRSGAGHEEPGRLVSLGGPVTNLGADIIIIIDDLMKAADAGSETERARVRDYCEQTLFTRLNNKATGRIA